MSIPEKIRNELLVEAQHRCTICSERLNFSMRLLHIKRRLDSRKCRSLVKTKEQCAKATCSDEPSNLCLC